MPRCFRYVVYRARHSAKGRIIKDAGSGQSSYLQIRNDAPVPDPVLTALLIDNAAYNTRHMGFSTASLTMRRCVRRSWALRRGRRCRLVVDLG
jgi:hypothetical protein